MHHQKEILLTETTLHVKNFYKSAECNEYGGVEREVSVHILKPKNIPLPVHIGRRSQELWSVLGSSEKKHQHFSLVEICNS